MDMKYVTRDASGKVNGLFSSPAYSENGDLLTDKDPLPMDHPDIIAYVGSPADHKWEEIKRERDRRRFYGGVKVNDMWFRSNETAIQEYTSIIIAGNGAPVTTVIVPQWRTLCGKTVDMTIGLAKLIMKAGIQKVMDNDIASRVHKEKLYASKDPDNYDYSGGWPECYEGTE